MTGDGRVIVPGAQIDIFPGPALPAVTVRQLTEDGVQAVLREVPHRPVRVQHRVDAGRRTSWPMRATPSSPCTPTGARWSSGSTAWARWIRGCAAPRHPDCRAARPTRPWPRSSSGSTTWTPGCRPAPGSTPSWQPYQPDALRLLVRNADADPPDDSGIGRAPRCDWPDRRRPSGIRPGDQPGRLPLRRGEPARTPRPGGDALSEAEPADPLRGRRASLRGDTVRSAAAGRAAGVPCQLIGVSRETGLARGGARPHRSVQYGSCRHQPRWTRAPQGTRRRGPRGLCRTATLRSLETS